MKLRILIFASLIFMLLSMTESIKIRSFFAQKMRYSSEEKIFCLFPKNSARLYLIFLIEYWSREM